MKGNRGGGQHPNGHPWRRMGGVKGKAKPKPRRSAADLERVAEFLSRDRPK